MKPITSEKTLYHPRAWVYVRAAEYGPALTELCESAQCAGYALVGQSYDLPQRLLGCHSGRNALLRAVRKGLIDDVFIPRITRGPGNRAGHRRLRPRDHLIRWIAENTARQTVENTPGPNPKIVGSCE